MKYLDNDIMEKLIRSANARTISKIWIITNEIIYYWGLRSLDNIFHDIDNLIPEIKAFLDVKSVSQRAYQTRTDRIKEPSDSNRPSIAEISPLGFRTETIKDTIPEIAMIRDRFRDAFISLPSGVEKTEAWLYPSALTARADADLEALVYFKSKGEDIVQAANLSETWRRSLNADVENDTLLNKKDQTIIEKAKINGLSIYELSGLYIDAPFAPFFIHAYDNEEEFILPTLFRTVEWFELNEFDPWLVRYANEISTAYQGGIDKTHGLYFLFYICRSDLLLKKASKFGLEALLGGICIGDVESSKPWKRYWEEPNAFPRNWDYADHTQVASIIIFAWQRIHPTSLNSDILANAVAFLFQSQLASGAWPSTTKETEGYIFATCLAITALCLLKPSGYKRYVEKAKTWLLSQQNEVGCFHIEGAPAVMLNILCLEALSMAEENLQITYNITNDSNPSILSAEKSNNDIDAYVIFCEGNPDGTRNQDFDEKCYSQIFASEYPNAVFYSAGSCTDIIHANNPLVRLIKKTNPYHKIIKLVDRDDLSETEIAEHQSQGVTVLSHRNLESYLLEDEIIKKLCVVSGKPEMQATIIAMKKKAIKDSIKRGNPHDDLKSAAGTFMVEAKRALGLTKCGNTTPSFLRDTMAPLLKPDTETYKALKKDIFGLSAG